MTDPDDPDLRDDANGGDLPRRAKDTSPSPLLQTIEITHGPGDGSEPAGEVVIAVEWGGVPGTDQFLRRLDWTGDDGERTIWVWDEDGNCVAGIDLAADGSVLGLTGHAKEVFRDILGEPVVSLAQHRRLRAFRPWIEARGLRLCLVGEDVFTGRWIRERGEDFAFPIVEAQTSLARDQITYRRWLTGLGGLGSWDRETLRIGELTLVFHEYRTPGGVRFGRAEILERRSADEFVCHARYDGKTVDVYDPPISWTEFEALNAQARFDALERHKADTAAVDALRRESSDP